MRASTGGRAGGDDLTARIRKIQTTFLKERDPNDAVEKVREEARRDNLLEIYGQKQIWYEQLAALASFPALRTSQFNEDGDDVFRSKLMFLVSFPSAVIVLLLIYIFTLPHFYSDYVDSKISTTKNYYGFDMFDNETNTQNRPISGMYASTYKALGFSFGISRVEFHHEIFFNEMQIVLFEPDGSTSLT